MIDLRTLGSAELEENLGSSRRPVAVQAKRMALVAYLALAGPGRYRRRDSIVALFWPDLDDEHARSALRQALTYLRRTLGASVLETRGEEEIALSGDALVCDAVLFDEAVAASRWSEAMQLYRGEFLEGLFVSDASPELGHWIEQERARLRNSAATCCWSLAAHARQRGDTEASVGWARRGAALAPDDEAKLRWLITLFDSIGDRAGAIESYERFAKRLAAEYAAEPSAETKELIAAVRRRSVSSTDAPSVRLTSAPSSESRPPAAIPHEIAGRSRRSIAIAGVAAALVLAVVGTAAYRRSEHEHRETLAVLPTQDLGRDTAQASLADAITEQLITDLARSRELRVINRRTMMSFRGSLRHPREIARDLDADAVLASTVTRNGDSVRLTVQLSRAGDDRIAWASSAPIARGDLFALSRRIADSVAEHTLAPRRAAERAGLFAPRSVAPAALDLYVQGRYWWNKRGPGLLRSTQLFSAALDESPTFALAYSGMADAYVQLGYGSLLHPDDAFPKARAAALRALELDSTLAEPHATLGFVSFYYDWDWISAEREFRQAIARNPSYATAHEWYGLFLTAMGRFTEARDEERQAQSLDPLSVAVAGTAAWVSFYSGRTDDAERELRVALRADSTFALGRLYLGRIHQSRGKLDSALAAYGSTGPLREWIPTSAAIGNVYGLQGRKGEALAMRRKLDSLSHTRYVTAYGIALVHEGIGQHDSAFFWLDRGVTERTHWLVWLRRDARFNGLHADPRFERLASRLQLPP